MDTDGQGDTHTDRDKSGPERKGTEEREGDRPAEDPGAKVRDTGRKHRDRAGKGEGRAAAGNPRLQV